MVSAAPIVTLATKSYKRPDGKRGDVFTVCGVLLGAVLIVAGAAGQLWIVAYTASELDLGTVGWLVWVGFGIAIAILLIYSFRSLRDLFERGTEAKPPDPKVEIEAATLIAKAIEAAASSGEEKREALEQLNEGFAARETAAAEPYRQRSRSALL